MHLAKPHLDIGLYTSNRDAQLAFWGETAGLPFDQMVKLGRGVQQHRFLALGSPMATIVKINHARDPIANATPTGLTALTIPRAGIAAPLPLTDPDGNAVELVPAGHHGIDGAIITLAANDVAASARFYRDVMGMVDVGGGELGTWAVRLGGTVLRLVPAQTRIKPSDMPGPGYRYMTVQVFDCDAEHAAALAKGAIEGRSPHNYGTTARVSFIRDPDGTWIEISQRASVTGKALP